MKVKVSLLVTAVSILKAIDTTTMKLSTSYRIRKILDVGQEAIMDFEGLRVALAEKHGTLNEAGTQYIFDTPEDNEVFKKDLNELLEDEVELDITPVPLELVDEYIHIAPINVPYVAWFISGLEE
jgi:hypothetical protein